MEAIIRKLKILQYKAEFSNSPDGPTAVKEKQESLRRTMTRLQDTLTELGRYEEQLQEWVRDHNDILTSLQELVARNQAAVRLLQDEQGILQYQRSKGDEALRQLEAMEGSLGAASSPQEAVSAIDESEARASEAEDWMDHCRAIFPDQNTAHTSLTVSHAPLLTLLITSGLAHHLLIILGLIHHLLIILALIHHLFIHHPWPYSSLTHYPWP